jgi:hypothetical protein
MFGGAVGHVAEFLDGLLDPDPGGLAHPVLAVHDPRDRRGGDAGQARDIEESYHFFPIGGIAVSSINQVQGPASRPHITACKRLDQKSKRLH